MISTTTKRTKRSACAPLRLQISNFKYLDHFIERTVNRFVQTKSSLLRSFLPLGLLLLCLHDTGQMQSASPALLLANELGPNVDPAQYLVSEKFDGVRAIWDGKVLRFRSGRAVNAPAWFIAKLPANLWMVSFGWRAAASKRSPGWCARASRSTTNGARLSYLIFELPGAPGTFAERAERIKEIVAQTQWPQLIAVQHFRVANRTALKRSSTRWCGRRRRPNASSSGRALCDRPQRRPAQAQTVAGHRGARSSSMSRAKANIPACSAPYACVRRRAKCFFFGTGFTDDVRKNPPPVGATVTYTYRGITKTGLPRFASYLRVRENF